MERNKPFYFRFCANSQTHMSLATTKHLAFFKLVRKLSKNAKFGVAFQSEPWGTPSIRLIAEDGTLIPTNIHDCKYAFNQEGFDQHCEESDEEYTPDLAAAMAED